MDGSGLAYLLDPPFLSAMDSTSDAGILYFEDFDGALPTTPTDRAEVQAAAALSVLTDEDVETARREGMEEGARAALADALLVQEQLRTAALQALFDAFGSAKTTLERAARESAGMGARAVIAVLQAAIPATMAKHAECEVEAVVRALLPGLTCLPELRVRAHPDIADLVRESLVGLLEPDGVLLCVTADPALLAGDLHLAWQDGGARRDCASIWNAVREALSPLGLPALQEVCRGC